MAKNKVIKKYEEELDDDFDFADDVGFENNEAFASMISGMVEVGRHQQVIATELTKLIVGKISAEGMGEDRIFAIFKRASEVVAESFPVKGLLEDVH